MLSFATAATVVTVLSFCYEMVSIVLQACTSLEVDVISLDLAKRLPFKLKPGPLQAALKRGLHFEVLHLTHDHFHNSAILGPN